LCDDDDWLLVAGQSRSISTVLCTVKAAERLVAACSSTPAPDPELTAKLLRNSR